MHLSDAEIAAVALESPERAPAAALAHTATCATCAAAVEQARDADRRTGELLQLLDHRPPAVTAAAVMTRARSRRWRAAAPIAASVLLFAAAGAAALPHSPVRRALAHAWISLRPTPGSADHATVIESSARAQGGVAITPDQALDVVFERPPRTGTLRISIDSSPRATVRSSDSTARYAVQPDRVLIVSDAAVAAYELVLPRSLSRITVTVGNRVVFRKLDTLTTSAVARDGRGVFKIDFASPMSISP